MILDFDGNNLKIIDESSLLKPSDVFQLKHWGFKKNDNIYLAKDYNLIELIDFLKDSYPDFSLTNDVQSLYNSVLHQVEQLQNNFELGRNIKDGNFDKEDYLEHIRFLKTHVPSRQLKDHQIKAFYHLSSVKNGANFSVPGSGKTTVVLSAYEKLE